MRTQTAARSQQIREQELLRDMQRALGLVVVDQETERRANARKMDHYGVTPGLHIVLSVQRGHGGLTHYFTFQSKTLIRDIAIMDAKRAAREQKLTYVCVLDVSSYKSDVPEHYLQDAVNKPK